MVTLSVIYLKFKAHLTSMATIVFCSDTSPRIGEIRDLMIDPEASELVSTFVSDMDNEIHTSLEAPPSTADKAGIHSFN